ncbi:hypothetical protein Q8F55_004500 [Vanrija albida]|uniref:Fumarylacetoacetase-like C-terminal domain-containing protein n=1 Tax=Vanrija albida TaxID=181172 RepID=A0ABR3Q772_9TREE
MSAAQVSAAAERLIAATATRIPCAPVRDLIGATDQATAYAVQQRVIAHQLAQANPPRRTGRKIGLTSKRVQAQIGVDAPDFGVLFSDRHLMRRVPAASLLQPKVEAEVAFVLSRDLDGEISARTVTDAIDYAVAAIEVVDSRIANWDITFADTVADNASFGAYVLGEERRTLAEGFRPVDVAMKMWVDGKLVSEGRGEDCLGDPINAVVWLASKAQELGDPLRKGEVVLSGALGPMASVKAGSKVEVEITGLGSVGAEFV